MPDWAGVLPGLIVLACLVVLDLALGTAITTSFIAAPFVTALTAGRGATIAVAAATMFMAVLSGVWHGALGSGEQEVRILLVVAVSLFAVFASYSRARSDAAMHRFEVLNRIATISGGTLPLGPTIEGVGGVLVPELSDIAIVDVVSDGRIDRAAVRSHGLYRAEIEAGLADRAPSLPPSMLADSATVASEPRFLPRIGDRELRALAHDDAGDLEFLQSLGARSAITVGLVARKRRIGALTLIMSEQSGRRYGTDDLAFASVLADRVARALDSAGLFSDLQSVEQRMDTVMSVLDEAVLIQDRAGELVFANDAAHRMFAMDDSKAAGESSLDQIFGRFEFFDEANAPLSAADLLPTQAFAQGAPALTRTVRMNSPGRDGHTWLRARSKPVYGAARMPLYAVTVYEDVTDIKEAELLKGVLGRTGELLEASTDYDDIRRRLSGIVVPELADHCRLHQPYPEEPQLAELTAQAERDGSSLIVVPLQISGTTVGGLSLVNDPGRRRFEASDRELAERVADRAAVALENARQATERAEIARTLQRGLRPSAIPEIPGWEAAVMYRPAGEENEVGGDFYDAFRVEDGWLLVMGDVTGSGATAASITAMARYTLRTAAALSGDPLVALEALNRSLLGRGDGALCTVAAVGLRSDGDQAVLAVAGHPPPLLIGESVREVGGNGPVLGAFDDAEWELERVTIAPREQLVLYTDGVIEASDGHERFGEQRLRRQLEEIGRELGDGAGAKAVVDQIEAALTSFCPGEPEDDAAVLAIALAGRGTSAPKEGARPTGFRDHEPRVAGKGTR